MSSSNRSIWVVVPASARRWSGNRVTAERWAAILRSLGRQPYIISEYNGEDGEMMIALHALKSHAILRRFRRIHPSRPLVVALTGTDLYQDIYRRRPAMQSLELADRLIVLQPLGVEEVPASLRAKVRVIFQSACGVRRRAEPSRRRFEVCVLGHLRPVKDPFRAAAAARRLPDESRIQVVHIGDALSPHMQQQAERQQRINPRYRWLGGLPRYRALQRMARCRLLALTSLSEGGANVISEAAAAGVPIVASRIAGSVGLLSPDYPGYFPVGDTTALAKLLYRAETDRNFYRNLQAHTRRLRKQFHPAAEKAAWQNLLAELLPT